MSDIFFIRHGQASFGQENYDRLSPLGVRQAEVAARHLARLGCRFDAVYQGTMERQQKTAGALLTEYRSSGLPIPDPVLCEAFDEFDSFKVWHHYMPQMLEEDATLAAELENIFKDNKTFQKLYEKVMHRWISTDGDAPEDLRWTDFIERVHTGIDRIMETHGSGRRVAIFTSGGPISAAVQKALDLSDAHTARLSYLVMNASITRFKYNADTFTLAGFNDTTHLEIENDRTLLTYR